MLNVTSLVGKDLELVSQVERYPLHIDGFTSMHRTGSGTKLLQRARDANYPVLLSARLNGLLVSDHNESNVGR